MERERRAPRDGTRRRRLSPALAGAALAATVASAPARAVDLVGRADLTWEQDQGLAASSDFFRQVYFLQFARHVSEPISYRLSLRFQDTRGTTTADGIQSPLRSQIVAPLASLQWRLDEFGLTLLYELNDGGDFDLNTNRFIARTIERYGGRLYWRPAEGLELSLGAQHQGYSSILADNRDDRAVLGIDYRGAHLRVTNDSRVQRFEDGLGQLTRTSYGPRLGLQYTNASEGRWSLAARYEVEYTRTEQRARASSAVSVPTDVQPAVGLYARTDFPSDTSATPMVSEPRLIDGNLDASAGIALGPDGASFHNIGFDMARVVGVDEVRVHVRTGAGQPVSSGGALTWTGYSSEDGRRWVELDGLAATFNAGLSAYIIDFTRTTARYFKVVNFGVNTQETYVTEMQSFVVEQVRPNETLTSETLRQTGAVVGTWRPWEKLLLTYSGLLNVDGFQGLRAPSRQWHLDTSNLAEVTAGPFASMRYGLRQVVNYANQVGITQSSLQTSLLVTFDPLQRANASLEARRIQDQLDAARSVTYSVLLSTRLEPYDSLHFSGTGGLNRQEVEGGATTQYVTGSGILLARLLGPFDLQLEATAQWPIATRGATAEVAPATRIASYQRYTAELRFSPSARLDLRARVGWAASDVTSGIVQSYRAYWEPFAGGALQIQFSYDESLEPLTGASYRQFSVRPAWTLNRNVLLSLTYNVLRGSGAFPVRQESFFVTLTLML